MTFYDKVRPVKQREVQRLQGREQELLRELEAVPAPLGFRAALEAKDPALIAEVKRASPSKGSFVENLDAAWQASRYVQGGASAVSVLTEEVYFRGTLNDLASVKKEVEVPVLRKDFILSELQVLEARSYGADAVLLIVGFLSRQALRRLLASVKSLGMEALVEVHTPKELEVAASEGAEIIGINTRNLQDLTVDLSVAEALFPLLPEGCLGVVESGIRGPADISRLSAAGFRAFLVGECLVRSSDPWQTLKELSGAEN